MHGIGLTGRLRMGSKVRCLWGLCALVLLVPNGLRSEPPPVLPDDPSIVLSEAFLNGHPDMKWRLHAVELRGRGRMSEAWTYFQRASRYADKPSQAMVAEMLWNGEGVARDRALAYVWMDLAAERGGARFVAWRERYWQALDEGERARALQLGPAVYAEFGDQVAKDRQIRAMRRAQRQITGSRTGYVGYLVVEPYVNGQRQVPVDGALFYAQKYWDPEQYWDWQDELWEQLPRGVIEVLPLLADDEPADEPADE